MSFAIPTTALQQYPSGARNHERERPEPLAIPCPIPYQGSKRRLAPHILSWVPTEYIRTFIEPFAGSAAMTLAVARNGRARQFVLSDILQPLMDIWKMILDKPLELADEYARLWDEQLGNPRTAYDRIRDEFNKCGEPAELLYLIVRCVKNAVRFNPLGEFNQSPDNRRLGMRPLKMRREIMAAHTLLAGKATAICADYRDILRAATSEDVVYMDPPYQGVSIGRDRRYVQPLDIDTFIAELRRLNDVGVPFIVSFDGLCGSRTYGEELPAELGLKRVLLVAGRSTQATLLGRADITVESLYLSPALLRRIPYPQAVIPTGNATVQLSLPT